MNYRIFFLVFTFLAWNEAKAQIRPSVVYDSLFVAVQMDGIFPDSKTFTDVTAKEAAALVMSQYYQQYNDPGFELKEFVDTYFTLPSLVAPQFVSDTAQTVRSHIEHLWPWLTRESEMVEPWTSLIPLPEPFVVPGGRFREIYYWDSYFTMLGLAESDRLDLMENMLDNFAYMIDTLGFIPNGNRTYYLSRSQPPFFSLMVQLWRDQNGGNAGLNYLKPLLEEYDFWMEGVERLEQPGDVHQRVVMPEEGVVLNRYWDRLVRPRPESYREDVETAQEAEAEETQVYRDLRAAAESGWDFSSRWLANNQELPTIRTTEILPVDLNCLLYHLEKTIAELYLEQGEEAKADEFKEKSQNRKAAIREYFFNQEQGYFTDYDWEAGAKLKQLTMATAFPLFFEIATEEEARSSIEAMQESLVQPGGLVTTLVNSGQQWDFPNGWPPLQYIGVMAMHHYGFTDIALQVAKDWVALNRKVYLRTGKMMEKYNVVDIDLEAGGGEYPLQDGFGWTNGVFLALQQFLEEQEELSKK